MRKLLTPATLLYTLFLAGFCICGLSILLGLKMNHLLNGENGDEGPLWTALLEVYSVPLAALLAGSIGHTANATRSWRRSALIVVLALLWNVFLAWKFVSILGNPPPERNAVVAFAELFARRADFLIAGALTFFAAEKHT
jgi:hypothetical protein